MKKSSVGSLAVIIGLLILSVMTLTAIYATSPETSVVLLDENFSTLDESRWKQEVVECTEDGNLSSYAEDGFTADGILRVQPKLTSPEFRIKREDLNKCYSCSNASSGLVKVRTKFRKGKRLRFRIAIVSNDSQSEDFNNLAETAEATATANDFAQLEIVFESAFNRTILKSVVTDEDFHIYEIKWNPDGITYSIDHKRVDEKTFEMRHQARNSSNERVPFTQLICFYRYAARLFSLRSSPWVLEYILEKILRRIQKSIQRTKLQSKQEIKVNATLKERPSWK